MDEHLTKHEKRLLKHKLKEDLKDKEADGKRSIRKNKLIKKSTIFSAIFIVLFSIIGYSIYSNSKSPGQYDNFAKCLTEKGAVMYGAIGWCKYTKEQAAMFGKSFKYLNYKDYKERSDIRITPTWIVNGEKLERVQSFDRLSSLTGCDYKS